MNLSAEYRKTHTPPPRPPHPLSRPLPPPSKPPRPRPLPLPLPLPPRSPRSPLSFSRMSSNLALRSLSPNARWSLSLALRISSFFSSTNVFGTPAGESCASSNRLQSAVIKAGVDAVRKPVRLICIFFGSGVCTTTTNEFKDGQCKQGMALTV